MERGWGGGRTGGLAREGEGEGGEGRGGLEGHRKI